MNTAIVFLEKGEGRQLCNLLDGNIHFRFLGFKKGRAQVAIQFPDDMDLQKSAPPLPIQPGSRSQETQALPNTARPGGPGSREPGRAS